jgi:elongation factor G
MNAVIWIAVAPRTDADRENLARGLAALVAEDPAISVKTDSLFGETIIGATWESHLEVILDRLKREFNVEASLGRPQIAYKEVLTRPADGEMKYARQRGGIGEYAHVKIHVRPGQPGTGFVFRNVLTGGVIPREFIKPIEYGIEEALTRGVLAGFPVEDVCVDLYDGSYHDLDSSETAFKNAGALAFLDAATKAGPVLLEPVMRVRVTVHHEDADDVLGNLVSRRGKIQSQAPEGDMRIISARVPHSELFAYSHDLHSRTRGRGSVVVEFDAYDLCPSTGGDEGDRDANVAAPRTRPPTLRNSGITLPEPETDESAD